MGEIEALDNGIVEDQGTRDGELNTNLLKAVAISAGVLGTEGELEVIAGRRMKVFNLTAMRESERSKQNKTDFLNAVLEWREERGDPKLHRRSLPLGAAEPL